MTIHATTTHSTAIIAPSARIGADVKIGPYACIEDDVVVGEGCVIGPHVCILRGTTLGDNCRVHAGAALGDVPQDRAFQGGDSYATFGSGCVIREGVTVHRGTQPGSTTRVGQHCLLMAGSHIGHNATVGDHVILTNNAQLGGHVQVGDRAVISANCLVHQFTRIGRLAMLAGACGVQMDVPPFCMTHSMQVNKVVNLNVVGLRRAGLSAEERFELQRAFRILYRSGLLVSRAVERLERELDAPHVRELCEFIRSSKRGICRYSREIDAEETPAVRDQPLRLVA
jgi:UDP-N-acetylglucosamine acyltransferase